MTQPFQPFVPADARLPELNPVSLIMGAVLGMIFGASSLYLVLKVGLTVSASIPVAVIGITLYRLFHKLGARESTVLEENIVQTAGSAGESIAFGVGVTMPAILILGFDLEVTRIMLVAVLGSVLGILMMIPLRRTMIVALHGELKYPEGTACAEVLKAAAVKASQASADAARRAAMIFTGLGVGIVYKVLNVALKGWKDIPGTVFGAPFKGGSIACEVSPELLGVGYIIGPRIAAIMCGGGVLAYLVLIPLVQFFGANLTEPLAPGGKLISAMSPNEIRGAYILYIGAGAVATAGIISLIQALPTIWHSIRASLGDLSSIGATAGSGRTDDDIPMKWVLVGVLGIIAAISLAAPLHMNVLGAILILLFGFLFVTVSSRLTGQVGSTSNPISGMTIATLLLTCLIFLVVGWTGGQYYVTALSVGAIVCIASSNAGTTSQDLKTGFLIGSTPRMQQYAIIVGSLLSAVVLGPILLTLNEVGTVYVPAAQVAPTLTTDPAALTERASLVGPQAAQDGGTYRVWHKTDDLGGPAGKYLTDDNGRAVYLVDPGINGFHTTRPDGTEVRKFDAPKAVLMSYIIKGMLERHLPWGLVLFGAMIAIMLEMVGIPSLVFAVGVYLPLSTTLPMYVGGAIRWWVDRRQAGTQLSPEARAAASDSGIGVLLSSGYIAGGALAGIVIAFSAGVMVDFDKAVETWAGANNPFYAGAHADVLSLIPFALLVGLLAWVAMERRKAAAETGKAR
ncbi:MAG TPA: oligopeptide transporter, OPT family [Rhodocyclaceae bacterium]|nr:oligopeptide transporter, OPT family [Rhodocyclaceae bacterium]